MKRARFGILIVVATTGLAACDDSTGPDSALTRGEAAALAEVLLGQTLAAGEQGGVAGQHVVNPLLARAPVNVDQQTTVTLPCPLGGTLSAERTVLGTVDAETGEVDLDVTLMQTHQGCTVEAGDSGVRFTLTGAPYLLSTHSLQTFSTGAFEMAGSLAGAVDWVAESREGTCRVELSFQGSGDGQGSLSMSLSGSICAVTLSERVSATP